MKLVQTSANISTFCKHIFWRLASLYAHMEESAYPCKCINMHMQTRPPRPIHTYMSLYTQTGELGVFGMRACVRVRVICSQDSWRIDLSLLNTESVNGQMIAAKICVVWKVTLCGRVSQISKFVNCYRGGWKIVSPHQYFRYCPESDTITWCIQCLI